MTNNIYELEGNELDVAAVSVSEALDAIEDNFDDGMNDWSPFDNYYLGTEEEQAFYDAYMRGKQETADFMRQRLWTG